MYFNMEFTKNDHFVVVRIQGIAGIHFLVKDNEHINLKACTHLRSLPGGQDRAWSASNLINRTWFNVRTLVRCTYIDIKCGFQQGEVWG